MQCLLIFFVTFLMAFQTLCLIVMLREAKKNSELLENEVSRTEIKVRKMIYILIIIITAIADIYLMKG